MQLTLPQIRTILELQAAMNEKVNPNWLTAGYPFLLAIVVKGSEALEHHGWKWWKKQDIDLPQLQMEMVDIWHFALSDFLIQSGGDLANAADILAIHAKADARLMFDGDEYDLLVLPTTDKIELLIGLAAARRFSVPLFSSLLDDCKMSWDDLYRQYVSKNVKLLDLLLLLD